MNIQKEEKNGTTGKYDDAKKENKHNNQECYTTNLINTDDKVNLLKNSNNANGSSEEIVGEKFKVNINQSVLKEGTTTAPVFKSDDDTIDDAKKKGNEEVHYKGSTGAAGGTPVKTSTEGVAHDKNSSVCNHNNFAKGGDNNYQHGCSSWGSTPKGENDDNKQVDTSVEAPPFNSPQKGSNNDVEEAQNAKMENRVSSKKENATMGEGEKQNEPIHSTNMNKSKGVMKDDLDIISQEGGKTEQGPKDDHPNDHIKPSVNGTASWSSKNTCPFKRNEYQKDKEKSSEDTRSNNVTIQKNGNYKKFPALNNAKNGTSFKKEVRRNNPNIGSSNRKSENYKTFGHSKRDECWKSCIDKNEDYSNTSGDYVRSGENYKNEKSYTHRGNSPNSSNNSHGRNEPHRVNEGGFRNGNPYTYRNAVNGGYKNVGGTGQMGNSVKMNDNFHNANNYKMNNYRNLFRNGNNEDTTGSANKYGEKGGNHNHSAYWMNQNEQHERYEQNGKNENFNFRRNNFKNKKVSTGVKQDARFDVAEKYAKKYDSNYFERNDSTNVGNHNGGASKKKVNSLIKQTGSTNYSKHLPIIGDTKGKETNGYEENDSIEVFTEGDASRNSIELVYKEVIHTVNHTSSSGTYNNSGEKTHNHIPRGGKKNSTAMGSPSHHGNIDQANKTYTKLTHTNNGKENQKESISDGGNSDHIGNENKWSFIRREDISDSGRSKINNSGEKDVMKGIRGKEYKEDYPKLEGEGSGAHVKKIERRAKQFTAHQGDFTKSHVPTYGNEYHHEAPNVDMKDHTNSLQSEKDKNPKNGKKQNHSNGPENKRKIWTPKIDQRSRNTDAVTLSSNFKELECWMNGRYNKLLEKYMDQENGKKNNSEIFEGEIKVYELCEDYTNSDVEKDSHENLSQMTETLESRYITEEDAAESKDNTDVQTNSEIENEKKLMIEGRGEFPTRKNKGEHVDNTVGDSYNPGKSNYFSGSKNHMHVLNSNAAHQGEKKYYQRNNNYRSNQQKRPSQLLHKNGPQNNKAPFFSSSSGKKWDNWGRTGGEEVVENSIEDEKLEGKLEENTDPNAEYNTDNNTDANATPSVRKYSARNKNNQGEEKASDSNFNRKIYYEKGPAGKWFGSSNITTKKPTSNNEFYKNKYHAGDQKNDYMKNEMNNGTFYKSNRQPIGQHNNKKNNWSAKLINDRFGNRYEEPFGEPFGERLNERFSKQNNSNDMDHTSGTFYASKKSVNNYVLLRNEMGSVAANNFNSAGNNKKSNSTYLTAKREGAKNTHYE
ncbi:Uncharacterized protein PCOAH_00032660 [Plasmodium coatneyi]|uniref:Uncharacterized protein n=1 Tax=Plasmodium coatneyi TaxID=208452 RepID=A0A1B1E297_9APIC|nr:Uncharacterized protein PCOAH_00032660 [Plasmodium coatneyi]ANQ09123.1 Uncharacterized protein PCOAH_00032660 [Plasmodium coatneyi]